MSPARRSGFPSPAWRPPASCSAGRVRARRDDNADEPHPTRWARRRAEGACRPPDPALGAPPRVRNPERHPDSFSDGSRFFDHDRAVADGVDLACQGADLIDVGGESTRPGAQPPTVDEELDRVVPVVERLARVTGVPLSVDTSRPEVMRAAVRAGASMINDVRALRGTGCPRRRRRTPRYRCA